MVPVASTSKTLTGDDSSKCFYCRNGHSSRCEKGALFGSPALDGAQAEYVSAAGYRYLR